MVEYCKLEDLFIELSQTLPIHKYKQYEVIDCSKIKIRTIGNNFYDLTRISRHKTTKHLLSITAKCESKITSVDVTTDHVCMVYNKDHFFENTSAKNLNVGQYVSIYDKIKDCEFIGTIIRIEDIGTTEDWVYDCEVDGTHAFYANDILVHNSQFTNLQCITDWFKKEYNLPNKLADWSDEWKLKLWSFFEDFVENDVNKYVQNLVKEYSHTSNAGVLRYSLEYLGDCGIYECPKHYGVHKIIEEGPELVDKCKWTGIELKKASLPIAVKHFLKHIYTNTLKTDWKEKDFKDYIIDAYDKFKKMSIDDIGIWKGYNTERDADGFLSMAKVVNPVTGKTVGATGISKAATYYNQLIDKLGLGKKYSQILLGDKVKFVYLLPNNQYRINQIAFKENEWPKEFDRLFQVDYETMFDKCVLSPLKKYIVAAKFNKVDPRDQMDFDINEL